MLRRNKRGQRMDIQTIGIVGAGQMGNGIAHVMALAGYDVLLNDVSAEALQKAVDTITGNLDRQVGRGKVTEADRDATLKRIVTTQTLAELGQSDLVIEAAHPIFDGIAGGDHVYFVHSYHFRVTNPTERLAHVDYGGPVTAVVGRDTMVGLQFHPEKSQAIGLRMIGNFLTWTP